jgi:GNAT superfamily N-acetyltransferase
MSAAGRDELVRARGFTLAGDEAAADRLEPWERGTAVLTPSLPELWDANYLRVEHPDGADAAALAAAAQDVLEAAGARHRAVVVPDGAAGESLREGFLGLGWDCDRLMFMALRGTPRQRPGAPAVDEVVSGGLAGLRRRLALSEPWGSAEVAREIEERERRVLRASRIRWFSAGPLAACCSLVQRDGVAEIDAVSTLPEHRASGLGRAVVVAAAGAARRGGAELVFLGAYRDDWPYRWYLRLGFEPVGMLVRFRRLGIRD